MLGRISKISHEFIVHCSISYINCTLVKISDIHRGFLQQIIDLDEKNQLLKANIWLNYHWYDVNLSWNKSEYNNIDETRFPPSKLWTPDILLFNSASQEFNSAYPTNVRVQDSGKCEFIPPGIFLSTCQVSKWQVLAMS